MPIQSQPIKRRDALARCGTALAAALAAIVLPWRRTPAAEELPKLTESDPMAKQLMYVHDATQAPAARKAESFCHNCAYFQGAADAAWGPCQIFPGKQVNAQGWCSVWTMKS